MPLTLPGHRQWKKEGEFAQSGKSPKQKVQSRQKAELHS
jgi:hypothetical protein